MATTASPNLSPPIPPGTSGVAVYRLSDWAADSQPTRGVAPPGAAVVSGLTSDASGAVAATGLEDDTAYVAGVQVGGTWMYVRFSTAPAALLVTPGDLAAGGFGTAAAGLTPIGAKHFGAAASTAVGGAGNSLIALQCDVPWPVTATGIIYQVGSVSAGSVRPGIYDAAGNAVARGTTDIAQSAANLVQSVPFDAPVDLDAGSYFVGLGFTLATATFQGAFTLHARGGGAYPLPATIVVPGRPVLTVASPIMGLY